MSSGQASSSEPPFDTSDRYPCARADVDVAIGRSGVAGSRAQQAIFPTETAVAAGSCGDRFWPGIERRGFYFKGRAGEGRDRRRARKEVVRQAGGHREEGRGARDAAGGEAGAAMTARVHVRWAGGGEARVVTIDAQAIVLRSTVPSPPGSRIEGTLVGTEKEPPAKLRVKVHGQETAGGGLRAEGGRWTCPGRRVGDRGDGEGGVGEEEVPWRGGTCPSPWSSPLARPRPHRPGMVVRRLVVRRRNPPAGRGPAPTAVAATRACRRRCDAAVAPTDVTFAAWCCQPAARPCEGANPS